jgi:hypothetical protein
MRVSAVDRISRTDRSYMPTVRRLQRNSVPIIETKVSNPVQHPVKLPSFDAHGRLIPAKNTDDHPRGNHVDVYV